MNIKRVLKRVWVVGSVVLNLCGLFFVWTGFRMGSMYTTALSSVVWTAGLIGFTVIIYMVFLVSLLLKGDKKKDDTTRAFYVFFFISFLIPLFFLFIHNIGIFSFMRILFLGPNAI
jgi:hypothetical protein